MSTTPPRPNSSRRSVSTCLVDLQGLTSGARPGSLVQRPAPAPTPVQVQVQVSYLSLPGTSAVPVADWMLADRFVMPPAPLPDRARHPLPDEAFVFCSFNHDHQSTADMFAALGVHRAHSAR